MRSPATHFLLHEWSLGYPLWRSYQPLPHLLGALVLHLGRAFAEPSALFAALLLGGRWMGLSPPAAGLAALPGASSSSTEAPLPGFGALALTEPSSRANAVDAPARVDERDREQVQEAVIEHDLRLALGDDRMTDRPSSARPDDGDPEGARHRQH